MKVKLYPILSLFSFLLLLSACGSDARKGISTETPTEEEISGDPLHGEVFAQAWEVVAGKAEARVVSGQDVWLIQLWNEIPAGDICDPFTSVDRGLIFSIPQEIGNYPLSRSQTLSFYRSGENLIAIQGLIRLQTMDLVSTPIVLGGDMQVTYDAANTVNGRFSVQVCD